MVSPGLWRENRLMRGLVCIKAKPSGWSPPDGNPTCERRPGSAPVCSFALIPCAFIMALRFLSFLTHTGKIPPSLRTSPTQHPPPTLSAPLTSSFPQQFPNMCPPTEETPATNGHTNGTNGANGSKEGFTGVTTRQNPHPTHKSPYAPVGDFLSNVGRFKIIGTS